MKKIVFVGGFGRKLFDFTKFLKALEKIGFKVYDFKYENCFGEVPIEELSKDFDKFIKKKVKKDFILIGYSQGGLIASYWLEALGGSKICRDFISVYTPFKGTYTSYITDNLKGVLQMRPKSKFLKKLNNLIKKSKTRYYTIWNPFDLMVLPGFNARLKHAHKKKPVLKGGHKIESTKKTVIKFLKDIVESNKTFINSNLS